MSRASLAASIIFCTVDSGRFVAAESSCGVATAIASIVVYPASISFCAVAGPTPGRSVKSFLFSLSAKSPHLQLVTMYPRGFNA